MFEWVVAAMAMTLPASGAGMAAKVEARLDREVLESDLATMWYEAFVAPDGTIEDCTVRNVIGDADAARRVCEAIVGRRATPAVGPDGRPAYGSFLGAINLSENYRVIPPELIRPDVTIQARGLPGGKNARVGVTVAVAEDGRVLACESDGAASALTRTACEQVRAAGLPVRKSKAGAAVGYLSPLIVEFEADRG